ncbi:MAG: PQQ-binding-like beta-propeller repeat protein [Oligoflexia bacterium]|nr:PQQ-binding-like beta-propeller repeat protein [Oligoflexia bacterium]
MKASLRLKLAGSVVVLAAIGGAGLGCSSPNIHKDLKDDPRVMVRKGTSPTRTTYEMGDRGTEYSNAVFAGETLIFGNQTVGLICLYPKMNRQRWSLKIEGGVSSELLADNDSVYFGGGDGYLYSVNTETGRVNWKYQIRNPIVSQPTVNGGRLFVTTSDDTIYAFDAGTGKWLWHYRRRSSPSATILGASSPLVDGSEVIAGLSDGFLVALNIADGQLKWERKLHTGTKFTDVDAKPVLSDGVIYVPSYDGALYALKRQGGDVIWRFDAGGAKRVIVEGDLIYLPASDGTVYALTKDAGKVVWKFELDKGVPTQLAVSDKYIMVGSSFQYLYVIDKASGKGVYRYNVGSGSGFYGAPAYDDKTRRIYILSCAGNLYAFELRKPPRKIFPHGQIDGYSFD